MTDHKLREAGGSLTYEWDFLAGCGVSREA